jgi:hypothetical protein
LVTLSTDEIEALNGGHPVTRLLGDDPSRELTVFGAIWIDAPAQDYLNALRDIERLEHGGGFALTKRLSDPPRREDFIGMMLPDVDVAALRSCRVGSCDIKLTGASIERLRHEVDWSSATAAEDASHLAQRMALSVVKAYQTGGNAALGIYPDDTRGTVPGVELSELIRRLPLLWRNEPELRRYLLDYPSAQLPDSTSFFYWQLVHFGLKPTIRINHVIIAEAPDHVVVASKQLYASHYFRAALEIRELIPDLSRGRGFWLIDVSSARVDGLRGFIGFFVRGRVRSEGLKRLSRGLQATKSMLERTASTN